MRRLKIFLLFFIGIIASITALVAVLLTTYDEEDYRRGLVELVHYLNGDKLVINGAINVRPSLIPSVTAEDIELQPNRDYRRARIRDPPISSGGKVAVTFSRTA